MNCSIENYINKKLNIKFKKRDGIKIDFGHESVEMLE